MATYKSKVKSVDLSGSKDTSVCCVELEIYDSANSLILTHKIPINLNESKVNNKLRVKTEISKAIERLNWENQKETQIKSHLDNVDFTI